MSELEKALEQFDKDGGWHGVKNRRAIIDAARRFASLTSPETIEKAAEAIAVLTEQSGQGATLTTHMIAEAVLRSVEEGTE